MSHDQAMFCDAFPCNPRPFRTALRDYLAAGGNTRLKEAFDLAHYHWTGHAA